MEQITISKAIAIFLIVAVSMAATASAQIALAPGPSMDAGAGIFVPVSGALIGFSLVISCIALLKHY
ncbi:hypothetical protein JCGZ_06805 [Jatropha curcas]|uniref:Uncharacterized protein n=1 Tax=Jatropha curcas TaxID=180498 RepID=A0A067KM86_JATCU|nr:hypothetical protein JCGZ_06805 [Jatropha curcas]